jgi:hypothetical protein
MELSPAYYQWEKETIDKGRLEERCGFVENLLKIRFSLSSETIAELMEQLLKLSPAESTRLLLKSSREEILKKLSNT